MYFFFLRLQSIRKSIFKILSHRKDTKFWQEWDDFFQSLPQDDEAKHDSYFDVMTELSKSYGDVIRVPSIYARGMKYLN